MAEKSKKQERGAGFDHVVVIFVALVIGAVWVLHLWGDGYRGVSEEWAIITTYFSILFVILFTIISLLVLRPLKLGKQGRRWLAIVLSVGILAATFPPVAGLLLALAWMWNGGP
jgi:hypothetical protein